MEIAVSGSDFDPPVRGRDAPPVLTAFDLDGCALGGEERLRHVIERTVGTVYGVGQDELSVSTRGRKKVALARQIAMYIGHVVCGQTLTDVGRLFARDRTTVAHACGVIEDLRDDPRFDQTLELLERIVRALLIPRSLSPMALQ